MSKKAKLLIISIIVICLAIISTGTLTFFTAESTARNTITTGTIDISVVMTPDGNSSVPVMPGVTVSKSAALTAPDGAQPAWVRAKLDITVYDAAGQEMTIDAAELARVIDIPCDSANWTETGGWWYYNGQLRGGEQALLFEQVQFSGIYMTDKYQGCSVEIYITAQAVQCANNGDSALSAVGWPN